MPAPDAPSTARDPDGAESAAIHALLSRYSVPCPGCSYNLRGIVGVVCPECGRTLRLEQLRRHRIRWLTRAEMIALGLLLGAIVLVIARSLSRNTGGQVPCILANACIAWMVLWAVRTAFAEQRARGAIVTALETLELVVAAAAALAAVAFTFF